MPSRNLFRARTAENISDDHEFVSLFGPDILDIFDRADMWEKMQVIQSSRGGGKTSLLRIFSPRSLNEIKTSSGASKLRKRLQELGVFSAEGEIEVLGVFLSLLGNYSVLENMDFDAPTRNRLFFALLSSKIIIAALRSICKLKQVDFSDAVDRIHVKRPDDQDVRACVPVPCSGRTLYDWAAKVEERAYDVIEGHESVQKNLGGYETLSLIHLIQSGNVLYDGKIVAEKTLLMLDDADKLTCEQRGKLGDALANLRIPRIWMAERLEALAQNELLSPLGTMGREYSKPLVVEKFWQKHGHRRFASMLDTIAMRRAQQSSDRIRAFKLDGNLGDDWNEKFRTAINDESGRLVKKFGIKRKYRDWFDERQNSTESLAEQAAAWRKLEILIERTERKKQTTLFTDEILPEEKFQEHAQQLKNVSKFYIHDKYGIPYYFGFDTLATLSSYNIRQFLELSSDLFDEMMNARFDSGHAVPPERQQSILRDAVESRWHHAMQEIQNPQLGEFLRNVAGFCRQETLLPNAPYLGVTGLAISMEDLARLRDPEFLERNHDYKLLAGLLSACFAHNLLIQNPDVLQGPKGTRHLVLYLNRLLCLKYGLPLEYGGWREKPLRFFSNLQYGTPSERVRNHANHVQNVLEGAA